MLKTKTLKKKKNPYNPFSAFDLCKLILITEHELQNMWH